MNSPAQDNAWLRAMPWVFVLIWSTGFVVARLGMPHAPPMSFLALRFALSAGCFMAWMTIAGVAWPARHQWPHLAASGVLMHAGYLGGVWSAVKAGMGAGTVALLVGLQPVLTAMWMSARGSQHHVTARQWLGLMLGLAGLLLVVPVGLIMKQPDLGTSLLVLAAGLSVIFFAGLSWRLIIPPVALAITGMVLLVVFEPRLCADGVRWFVLHDYQQQRICTLLDPTRDPLGKGFHIIQGMIAIGSGGLFGKGFMQGTQTHLEFIPERTTDFIFAAFSEEFGLLGNLLLIAGFIFLILRGLTIALEASTLFSRLLAGAITLIFFTYAFVNMGMVSGILPVVGVPLPFISYGGTAMVTLGAGLGILMSIAKARRLVQS